MREGLHAMTRYSDMLSAQCYSPESSSDTRRMRDEPDYIRAHRNDSSYDGSLAQGFDGGPGLAGPLSGLPALQVVLHALRDRLPVEAVAALGSQLPLLVRGMYYEGWSPSETPVQESEKEEFLSQIAAAFRNNPEVDPERSPGPS